MSRILPLTIIFALLAFVAAFLAGPIWSFYDLRSSAEAEDIQSLAELVAFDDVRTSLKAQLITSSEGESIAAPPPSFLKDPIGAVAAAIVPMTKPAPVINIDSYLTARALWALTLGAGKDANKVDPRTFTDKPPVPEVLYWSPDRTRLSVTHPVQGETIFTLKRKTLFGWQLMHVGLPGVDDLPATMPVTPSPEDKALSSTGVKSPVE